MGLKMKHPSKKPKKHKRFEDHESDSDEKNADGNKNAEYDIEASDDEFDEVPSKWYDEVTSSPIADHCPGSLTSL